MKITAIILALVAIILSFLIDVPYMWPLSLIIAVISIVFGGISINEAKMAGGEGRGLAITALASSILALLWIIIHFCLVVGAGLSAME